jgi:hypothetical protein
MDFGTTIPIRYYTGFGNTKKSAVCGKGLETGLSL